MKPNATATLCSGSHDRRFPNSMNLLVPGEIFTLSVTSLQMSYEFTISRKADSNGCEGRLSPLVSDSIEPIVFVAP